MGLIKKSKNFVFCGVCAGMSESLGINANVLRVLWLISVFCYGIGLILYTIMCIALPGDENSIY